MSKGATAIDKIEVMRHIGFSNREAYRMHYLPCEWEPIYDRLSRLSDPFHGEAVAESSMKGYGALRVCDSCSIRIARINGGGK